MSGIIPHAYDRVVFTCDWFKVDDRSKDVFPNPGEIHVDWIYAMYSQIFASFLTAPLEKIYGSEPFLPFNRSNFYTDLKLPFRTAGWASSYREDERAISYLIDRLERYRASLFIGFELSPLMIEAFNASSIHYIDLTLHAVRFLPDYIFGIRTNIPGATERLQKFVVPKQNMRTHASLSAARSSRIYRNRTLRPGSIVFIGQIDVDSSLISNRQMIDLSMILDELNQLSINFPSIHYKFHPHHKDRASVEKAIANIPRLTVVDANIYDILAAPEPAMFCSISSGTLHEAALFDRPTLRLSSTPSCHAVAVEELPHDRLHEYYMPIGHSIFEAFFWEHLIFEGSLMDFDPTVPLPVDALKFMINQKWGR